MTLHPKSTWTLALGFAWTFVYFVGIPLMQRLEPSSNWLVVHKVEIENAHQGEDPEMRVMRTWFMKKPVWGKWKAKITNSHNVEVCINHGEKIYHPDARAPSPGEFKLIGWRFYPENGDPKNVCEEWPLPVGKYCLHTRREFFPDNYPNGASKIVDSPIACFSVTKKPT